MLTRQRSRAYAEADLGAVDDMLRGLTGDSVFERANLEARRQEIVAEMEEASTTPETEAAGVDVVFSGGPVIGSVALDARFGVKALDSFQRAVTAATATDLGRRGPLPQDLPRLHITGVIRGSFGFRLEEFGQLELGGSRLGDAIKQVSDVLDALRSDADAFADTAAEANPRVVSALRDFVGLLNGAGALCVVAAEDHEIRFDSTDVVEKAAALISSYTVTDAHQEVIGEFLGVLPVARRFEHQSDTGELWAGRIARELGDPEDLRPFEGHRCVATIRTTTTSRPQGTTTRHALVKLSEP